ncbi:MAG TPA: glycosyltransferase family 4 protein [Candidatus Limnocylindria bacterium]|nr:glycosyltransferase family 4 protein [Candidatus Limnocylindria bacterium]
MVETSTPPSKRNARTIVLELAQVKGTQAFCKKLVAAEAIRLASRGLKILVITNLFPPHHAGTFDLRCEAAVNNLKLRGHQVRVLTSTHGMHLPQQGGEVERRLLLNGVYDHELVTNYNDLKKIEVENHAVLRDAIAQFTPEVVHIFSLFGISKSFLFHLRHCGVPTVYDVADNWLTLEVKNDPWLRWWNHPAMNMPRKALELSGQRNSIDDLAPTRLMKGYDRMPELYGANPLLNSLNAFRFERIYFASPWLKESAELAGFQVGHGEVIYPGIAAQTLVNEVKPASESVEKFLVVTSLHKRSGVLTAVKAIQQLRKSNVRASLSIYGKGDSSHVAELRSLIALQQLPVEFLNVSNLVRDLPAVYRRHDALLYTSEEPEPFSLTVLEAMAAGLPVVGTALGGTRELLRHGENAFTYTPGEAYELAMRIQELRLSPALRTQMAETAQGEVLSDFNETVVTDRIEAFLETSLQSWQQS